MGTAYVWPLGRPRYDPDPSGIGTVQRTDMAMYAIAIRCRLEPQRLGPHVEEVERKYADAPDPLRV